jgi:mediator of RNA polymerase II transcription subunit 27
MELQESLGCIESNFKSAEANINQLNPPGGPFNLGNAAFLNHETDPEHYKAYNELVDSYRWHDKTHAYSLLANMHLCHNSLKRTMLSSSNKRRSFSISAHTANPKFVDQVISNINVPNMTLKIYRPFNANAFLHVSLSTYFKIEFGSKIIKLQVNIGRVLKAAVILRGLMIEWVTVKGFNETLDNVDDHWVESRYEVFRSVQDVAHHGMMHFYAPTFAELALRSFMTWFGSYANLFSEPCKKCGKFLLNNLPPTYRDFRTLDTYHEECRH